MLLRFLTIIYQLSLTAICYAQDTTELHNRLTFSLGAVHTRFADQAFSHNNLRFSGTAFTPAVIYERQLSNNSFVQLFMQGNKGSATSPQVPAVVETYQIQLSLSYARHIASYRFLARENNLYLGAQAGALDYMLLELEVIEDGTPTFYYTANAYVRQQTRLDQKSELYTELSLPLAGFVKRTSYDGGINQQLESEYLEHPFAFFFSQSQFSVLNPFYLPQLHIRYIRHLAAKTDCVFHYQFHYLANNDIAPIRLYSNGLLFGLNFQF